MLGGTVFVGRAVVEAALARGHEVTLFNRGRSAPQLFPRLERRPGDRERGDYRSLEGGRWDCVADVSGYVPRHLGQAMDALGDRVERYLFISSHAVYRREGLRPGATEDTPRRPPLRDAEELDGETYGPLKVACEDDLVARYGERATIVRAGKVAGPHDPSDMFTYWVRRAAWGGRVALPADPRQPVQVLDVDDLGQFVTRLLEDRRPGAFQAVGPARPTTLGGLIETCARVAGSQVELVQVQDRELPALFPLVRSNWASQLRSSARARAAGLPATPLAETAARVLAWDRARGLPALSHGFTEEQERSALEAAAQPRLNSDPAWSQPGAPTASSASTASPSPASQRAPCRDHSKSRSVRRPPR